MSEGRYFKEKELVCKCGCGLNNMNVKLVHMLDRTRDLVGNPIYLSSGSRCAEHNKNENGSPTSSHLKGLAADIRISNGTERYKVVSALLLVGFSRIGISENFIHVDLDMDKTLPIIWGY